MSKNDTKSNWVDPDDAPELTEEWFAKAALMQGETVIRRGRPRGSNKVQVAIRLDTDVIQHFKLGGAGWQSRINAALKDYVNSR